MLVEIHVVWMGLAIAGATAGVIIGLIARAIERTRR